MDPPVIFHGRAAANAERQHGPAPVALRRAFLALHWTLGAVVLAASLRTTHRALLTPDLHLALLAGVESIAATLFLVPATLALGGGLMIATFAVAFVAHGAQGDLRTPLLVYAVATAFVMVHDATGRRRIRTGCRFDASS